MHGTRCLSALVLLVLLAVTVTATALQQEQLAARTKSRKLLQPFDLGIPAATRRSGNVGNTGERRTNALSFNTAGLVDTGRRINNTIRARTSSVGETTNLNFGGAGKTSTIARGRTDNNTANTLTGVDVRSISLPGPGVTASRAIDSSNSLAAKRLKPAGQPRNASTLGRYEGPNDNVPAGAWEVLGAGALDYGFAGDYDYSLITAIVDKRSFIGFNGVYDYDYGRPRPIPESAVVTTRTRTNLNNAEDRASGFGRMGQTATAPNAVARGAVITSGIWGNNAARFNDDIFGNAPVFVPPNQFRQAGASVSGVGLSKNYKGNPLPGAATNLQNAGTTVTRRYVTGGAADQLNYAHGTQAVSVRSQNVALSGEENIDFDVGRRHRRRRLQAVRHGKAGRRLHTVAQAPAAAAPPAQADAQQQ